MPENVGKTRLAATKKYVEMLLEKLPGVSLSVVAAKGDGVLLSPLTDDRTQTALAIQYASPTIMTSVGTNIGKGLEKAIQSFPPQSAKAGTIIVFTVIATTKTINGYTYLYPLIPFDKKAFKSLLYRRPLKCKYK